MSRSDVDVRSLRYGALVGLLAVGSLALSGVQRLGAGDAGPVPLLAAAAAQPIGEAEDEDPDASTSDGAGSDAPELAAPPAVQGWAPPAVQEWATTPLPRGDDATPGGRPSMTLGNSATASRPGVTFERLGRGPVSPWSDRSRVRCHLRATGAGSDVTRERPERGPVPA